MDDLKRAATLLRASARRIDESEYREEMLTIADRLDAVRVQVPREATSAMIAAGERARAEGVMISTFGVPCTTPHRSMRYDMKRKIRPVASMTTLPLSRECFVESIARSPAVRVKLPETNIYG